MATPLLANNGFNTTNVDVPPQGSFYEGGWFPLASENYKDLSFAQREKHSCGSDLAKLLLYSLECGFGDR